MTSPSPPADPSQPPVPPQPLPSTPTTHPPKPTQQPAKKPRQRKRADPQKNDQQPTQRGSSFVPCVNCKTNVTAQRRTDLHGGLSSRPILIPPTS